MCGMLKHIHTAPGTPKKEKKEVGSVPLQRPRIELGSSRWQRPILAIILPLRLMNYHYTYVAYDLHPSHRIWLSTGGSVANATSVLS